MIVKDESAVIERCLRSIKPHIDYWVIVDTGSTDDTMTKIEAELAGIPGSLHQRPWRNFGDNRTEALDLAYESKSDYILFMDADDKFAADPDFTWPELDADAYDIQLQLGQVRYTRTALVSTRLKWRWVGVIHEYPDSSPPFRTKRYLPGVRIYSSTEGARSRDPDKYRKDAALLNAALQHEPHNTRYIFYLGQSLRDAGDLKGALKAYRKRSLMGGWAEEAWCATLEAARLEERLGNPLSVVEKSYLNAYERRVQRAEPLVDLARLMRLNNRHGMAYLYASQACKLPMPQDSLFVEQACYDWMRWDELSIAAYWVGEFNESLEVCERLLCGEHLPEQHRDRVTRNREFALAKVKSPNHAGVGP